MTLCHPQITAAQWTQYGTITQGIFGTREIGRPLVAGSPVTGIFGPRAVGQPLVMSSAFANNIQFNPSGFLTYHNQFNGYPVTTPYSVFSAQATGYAPNYSITPDMNNWMIDNGFAPTTNITPVVGPAGQTYPANPGLAPVNAIPGAVPAGTTPGSAQQNTTGIGPGAEQQNANPGTAPAATANVTPQRGRFHTASVLSANPQPYSLSPELSDRLTSIARTRGMLVGKGINVYLGDNVALLQGTARTPNDRNTLANVLSLEPGVGHIDNRLLVRANGE